MMHYTIGPVEEAFGKPLQTEILAPPPNNDFFWGVLSVIAVTGIISAVVYFSYIARRQTYDKDRL